MTRKENVIVPESGTNKNSQMQAEMIITSAQAIEIANAEICIFISLLMGSVVFEISMETKKAGR